MSVGVKINSQLSILRYRRPAEAFDWAGYLTLADNLAAGDEASHRSPISRSYYYVYHIALTRALRNNFQFLPGESTHSQLWRVFTGSPDPDTSKLGAIGTRLKLNRERADYDDIFVRVKEEVPAALSDARDFAARLAKLPTRFPNPISVRR
jgi:hypothetical protein